MNPALQQLKDIHLPSAIPMWPIAPGWIAIYGLAAGLFTYAIYFFYKKRKKLLTVKHALQQLQELQQLTVHNPKNINIAAEISTLIRRTALYYFPREKIAGLSGTAWLDFLNRSSGAKQFTIALIEAPYQQQHDIDLVPLFSATQDWLSYLAKNNKKEP